MGKVQIIRTPSGEELVVLPRADYDALVAGAQLIGADDDDDEDAADIAVFDERMAELRSNRDAALPAEVSQAMLRGATLVQALRKWRGVKQQDLAAKAELAQGYLSDIERGRGQGSREAREKIARALDVPREWLV
jgi:ribosome-binding protein aMBF1 (putative translation factor)